MNNQKYIASVDCYVDIEIDEQQFIEGYNIGWKVGYHQLEQHVSTKVLTLSWFKGYKKGAHQGFMDS